MNNFPIRLLCPSSSLSKAERVSQLFCNIEHWLKSPAMQELVRLFNGTLYSNQSLKEYIKNLNDFVEVWNYRQRSSAKNSVSERWNVFDDEFVQNHRSKIMSCAYQLGLVESTIPTTTADYILPLGGARYSNRDRALYARKMYNHFYKSNSASKIEVVALSGTRPIADAERQAVDEYARDAITEFQAISRGLELAFDLSDLYEETISENSNPNLISIVRRYSSSLPLLSICSIAAPSTVSTRRANSRDTFEYFLKEFEIKKGNKILLVTSQIYVPYQLLKFVDLAIEKDYDVDCVGYGMESRESLAKPSNYLQEVKATVNAIKQLADLYL